MAKFNQLKVGTKFKIFNQIYGWSKEREISYADSKIVKYSDDSGNDHIIYEHDCENVVVVDPDKDIDNDKIKKLIREKVEMKLESELKKLNDPYYSTFVNEHFEELDIDIEIGFKEK